MSIDKIAVNKLFTGNIKNDSLLEQVLLKENFNNIEEVQSYFGDNILCKLIKEEKNNREKNLYNIVLIKQVEQLQKNYKENISLLIRGRKKTFIEQKETIKKLEETNFNLSLYNLSLLIEKTKDLKDIDSLLEGYKNLFIYDAGIFHSISKKIENIEDLLILKEKYGLDCEEKTIILLLKRFPQAKGKILRIIPYNQNESDSITKERIKILKKYESGLALLEQKGKSIELINALLYLSKEINEIELTSSFIKKGNLETFTLILSKIKKLEELKLYKDKFSINELFINKNNKRYYFLQKIIPKFGYTDLTDFFREVKSIFEGDNEKEITEENWFKNI